MDELGINAANIEAALAKGEASMTNVVTTNIVPKTTVNTDVHDKGQEKRFGKKRKRKSKKGSPATTSPAPPTAPHGRGKHHHLSQLAFGKCQGMDISFLFD